jgi:hypothetical protein
MSERHIETAHVPGRRLGFRRADPERPLLQLHEFLTGAPVPAHAAASDHFGQVSDWGLYDNDQFGDCGPTSVANSRKLVTRYLAGAEQSPSQDDVFDLYRRSGNPQFDPATDADDNGVDMPTMLSAVLAGGIGGVKGIAYAAVDVHDLDEVRAAIDIFGFLLLGVDLETAQQRQTDAGLWDYRRSGEWGGHAVLAGKYTGAAKGSDVSVVTWGEVVGTTDAFWQHQVEEAYVVIWPEHLGTAAFQTGINTDALNTAYTNLTGKPGPFPGTPGPTPSPEPVPVPSPTPTVDPADAALAVAQDVWRRAKGL